jgi:hypothetical protein
VLENQSDIGRHGVAELDPVCVFAAISKTSASVSISAVKAALALLLHLRAHAHLFLQNAGAFDSVISPRFTRALICASRFFSPATNSDTPSRSHAALGRCPLLHA